MKMYRLYASAFAVFLGVSLSGAAPGDEREVGRITRITGTVTLIREGEKEPLWPKLSDPVFSNDIIETGTGGHLQIFFYNDIMLELSPAARIRIDESITGERAAARSRTINLLFGKARAVVEKLQREGRYFEVGTPNAIAGVAGTSFIVRYASPGKTEVFVLEGVPSD